MVETARLKVTNDKRTQGVGSRKRKSKLKTVEDYLIKANLQGEHSEIITADMIVQKLLCPVCNHRSLIVLTSKDEASKANRDIKALHDKRLKEWIAKG